MKMNLLQRGHELIPIDDGAFDLLSFRSEIPVGTVFPDGEILAKSGGNPKKSVSDLTCFGGICVGFQESAFSQSLM